MIPPLESVMSSTIKAVGYDADGQRLFVEFNSGGEYVFQDVPPALYRQLLAAESVGRFFAKNIRGKFSFQEGFK